MTFTILDLNLNILVVICEQIETFGDKKNFARAHPKLWNAFAEQNRKKIKTDFDLDCNEDEDYIEHWDFVLEWWGPSLTLINNREELVDSGELIEMAVKFCPNLDYVVLNVENSNIEKLEENLPKFKSLEYIEFHYVEGKHKMNNLIGSLQCLTNLRKLVFSFWTFSKDEREQLNKLVQLTELKIGSSYCDEDLSEIPILLGHLRVLRIGITQPTTLSYLAEQCTRLEKLIITELTSNNDNNTFSFPYFPKLMHLDIHICRESRLLNFISHLDSRYNEQLETLGIHNLNLGGHNMDHIAKLRSLKQLFAAKILPSSFAFDLLVRMPLEALWVNTITQNEIFRLLIQCSSLMELKFNCSDINKDFLPLLLRILVRKGIQPDRPFKITMGNRIEVNEKLMAQMASNPTSNLLDLRLYGFYS